MNEIKFLANQGNNYYKILQKSDGSIEFKGKNYQNINAEDDELTLGNKTYYAFPSRVTISGKPEIDFPNWASYTGLNNGYGNAPVLDTSIHDSFDCIGVGDYEGTKKFFCTGVAALNNGFSGGGSGYVEVTFDESCPMGIDIDYVSY